MVAKEIWIHLLAYNLIRTVMAEAAARHGRTPRTVGFKHAVQLWSAWQRHGARLDEEGRRILCSRLVQRRVGNRPGRARAASDQAKTETESVAHDAASAGTAGMRTLRAVLTLNFVPLPSKRVSGPGSSPVLAAFTHPSPVGSRFAAPGRGAYHAARSLPTAIAEARFHRARFLAATRERSIEVSMRVYVAGVDAMLHDVRGRCVDFPAACVDGLAGYPQSAAFAGRLRDAGSAGIAYDSVRHASGQCVALFRPGAIRLPVIEHAVVRLVWDGDRQAIVDVFGTRTLPDG